MTIRDTDLNEATPRDEADERRPDMHAAVGDGDAVLETGEHRGA